MSSTIDIIVQLPSGFRFPLEIEEDAYTVYLKEDIEDKRGIPFFAQKLIANGEILEDGYTMKEQNITKNSVVHVKTHIPKGRFG